MRDEWRPIKSAPKDTFVLIATPGLDTGPVTVGILMPPIDEREENGRWKKKEWWPAAGWFGMDGDSHSSICEPTHWMPLPDPPIRVIGGR